MESLASKTNAKGIRETFATLPKTVKETYNDVMSRIGQQNQDHVSLAHRVLMWISNARTPLTLTELSYAISIGPDATEFDVDSLEVKEIFLSACAGMVVLHKDSGGIRLVRKYCQYSKHG
jgi:hypothetical protein